MNRILLGKAPSGESGLWVSKPGVNVFAFAGNSYYDDAYGFNENFSWTGSNTYTHDWVGAGEQFNSEQTKIETTSRGTILFNNNRDNGDPYFIHVMNTNPVLSTGDGYSNYHREHTEDTSFNGNTYPILEFRVRRPLKSDGTHWQISDLNTNNQLFRVFYATSNNTNDNRSIRVPTTGTFQYNRGAHINDTWDNVLGTSGQWTTIEYNFETGKYQWERDDGVTSGGEQNLQGHGGGLAISDWASNTAVHLLRFDFFQTSVSGEPVHSSTDADLEVDYIRAKKRGVPINFGNSINDNFHFSSDWAATGLVHASGRVVLGNEYAWANGYSKDSGTSHPGSTSGRVKFDRLPYIPVVLFQRYDPNQTARATFPGGDKEFSVAHCDMTSNTPIWNPLTKKYQPSTNTAYGSEYRTFAYARAGYDHFDVTCRNAIARDGFEHLFNYTPQEPYVEIYKGGNYDPESENPETFVMYPQQVQATDPENPPKVDNGLFGKRKTYLTAGNEVGESEREYGPNPLSTVPRSQPKHFQHNDKASRVISGRDTGSGFSVDNSDGTTEFYQNFGDAGVDGYSHAAGRMKDGVLGLRRGKVITTDDLPSEGFDSSVEGAGGDFIQYTDSGEVYKLTGNPSASDSVKVLMNGGVAGDPSATFNGKGPLGSSVVNTEIYTASGLIGTDQYSSSEYQLDWSARDHMDGKLGYFSRYTGMDKGNCLPTFDWANKFGDWNVPQFNNFYQYDPDIGAGSYTSFKDAIGTTWTANNTKFLDDSMWLGYANNRFEYKGDIWHPQAPTKTYDELSGVFGFGGTIAHQGDWHDFAGTPRVSEDTPDEGTLAYAHGFVGAAGPIENYLRSFFYGGAPDGGYVPGDPYFAYRHANKSIDYKSFPGHGYTGIHLISRYDANASFDPTVDNGAFAVDIAFRNRYMYRPFNGLGAKQSNYIPDGSYDDNLGPDYQPELGMAGPGTQATYGRIHDYGRTGIYAYTDPTYGIAPFSDNDIVLDGSGTILGNDDGSGVENLYLEVGNAFHPNRWGVHSITPPNKFWSDLSGPNHTYFSNPWVEPDSASPATSIWTLGGRYEDGNFSSFEDYDLPSITEQQTGQYGHKDSFVVSRWYTYPGATFSYDISNFSGPAHYDAWYKNDVLKETNDYKRKDYPQLYTGGWGNYGYFPTQEQLDQGKGATRLFPTGPNANPIHDYQGFYPGGQTIETGINGPFTIFKKRARYGNRTLSQATYDNGEAYVYFVPNSLHSDKQISRTFGIPNDIAGDYYVASKSHRERGPQYSEDPFHGPMGAFTVGGARSLHDRGLGNEVPYFDVANNYDIGSNEWTTTFKREGGAYPDYKLIDYLRKNGIDVETLDVGEPIPIKADPYFAGMAFYGTDSITGAFNAHRFEFKIKKTKTHINHFRQSYEYNLPGRSGHRAETLRPIGYGLMTNVSGFDFNAGPPPAAHSYFDARQLGGGYPLWRDVGNETSDIGFTSDNNIDLTLVIQYLSGTDRVDLKVPQIPRSHHDGTIVDIQHPAFSNTYFANKGWGDYRNEVKYDNDILPDPAHSTFDLLGEIGLESSVYASYTPDVRGFTPDQILSDFWTTYSRHTEFGYQSVSMSRHGRDSMVNGIIGAVEVSNTYFADYKATYWDAGSSQLRYWITGTTAVPSAPTNNDYYNLQRPLRYRPAKSQGASPETQMYGAYLNPPFNRYVDYHRAWAGLNSHWHSTGNHWEDDVLPGMCKADNALTNWGTVDLSKFDHNHIGYKWHNDAWHDFDNGSGIAESIVWAPSKTNNKWSDATNSTNKGQGLDPYQSLADPAIIPETRNTKNQKGGTYDGFKLHERPEFQPVTGDGRYFGGVGGVDNWGGTSYNTWGPGMSVSPTVWELKWTNIRHPLGVSPVESEDANTFYGATSIQNQTSLIGGAPNSRRVIGDDGGTFTYSDGSTGFGTPAFSDGTRLNTTTIDFGGYRDEDARGGTPKNYDWAIGGSQIQCNYWDRTLKIKDLEYTDGLTTGGFPTTGRSLTHANNGIQAVLSLKVKGTYIIEDGSGERYWVLENNSNITSRNELGWNGGSPGDTLVLKNTPSGTEYEVTIVDFDSGDMVNGTRVSYPYTNAFDPILVRTTGGSIPDSDAEPMISPAEKIAIERHPQLVLYNKTLAEDTSRHPAGAFKANTTYHFQYMYDESKINPPEYIYWVLRIPASMDSYNGESLI